MRLGGCAKRPSARGPGARTCAPLYPDSDCSPGVLAAPRRSWSLYFAELESAYGSALAGTAPVAESGGLQYGDYAAWERNVFSAGSQARLELVEWWKNAVKNQPVSFDLPSRTLRRRKKAQLSEGWMWRALNRALKARIADLAGRASTTPYVIGLAVFGASIAAVTGERHFTIGTHMRSGQFP